MGLERGVWLQDRLWLPVGILRRLKRDSPDLAERVVKGEISANAAAIEAGFRRRKVQIPIDDIDMAARLTNKHFGDRIDELIDAITRHR